MPVLPPTPYASDVDIGLLRQSAASLAPLAPATAPASHRSPMSRPPIEALPGNDLPSPTGDPPTPASSPENAGTSTLGRCAPSLRFVRHARLWYTPSASAGPHEPLANYLPNRHLGSTHQHCKYAGELRVLRHQRLGDLMLAVVPTAADQRNIATLG